MKQKERKEWAWTPTQGSSPIVFRVIMFEMAGEPEKDFFLPDMAHVVVGATVLFL